MLGLFDPIIVMPICVLVFDVKKSSLLLSMP